MGFKGPFQPKSPHAFNPQDSGVHSTFHIPTFQSHWELNQPCTSLDIPKAVNKTKPQQGQSEQTVRDVGSWIIPTANVITD